MKFEKMRIHFLSDKQAIATTQCSKKKFQYIINTACERYIENAMKHRFHS